MKKIRGLHITHFILGGFLLFIFPFVACAGNIDSTWYEAQFERSDLGSIHFGLSQGDVTVTDTGITGYAWSEDIGWINLNPANGGVVNDGEGNLSGYAWGENTGWINFNPTNGGVVIQEVGGLGEFSGYAWAEGHGWISFNCSDDSSCGVYEYKVRTTWTPEEDDGDDGGTYVVPPPDEPPVVEPPVVPPVIPPIVSPPPVITGSQNQCGDGIDNDGDGLPDELDPSCHTDRDPNNADSYDPTRNENSGPRIDLLGPLSFEIIEGSEFIDPGFRAYDAEDGDLTSQVRILGIVDTGVLGVYEIRYSVTDSAGESYTVVRRVIVQRESVLTSLFDLATLASDFLRRLITTPLGSAITRSISFLGILIGLGATISSLFSSPLTLAELFFIPFRVASLFASFFGLRKRTRPWGTVYDAVTKQPLDPAQVTLMDTEGNDIDSVITDLDGRFGFLVEPGFYRLRAEKTHYQFPSNVLSGKGNDDVYNDLYFGGLVEVTSKGGVISKNIPLDPIGFDWNEFAKREDNLTLWYSKYDRLVLRITDILFYLGFVIAALALFVALEPYNYIIFGLYILLIVVRVIGIKGRQYGKIIDVRTGRPFSYAVMRVLTADGGNLILKKSCDRFGRYFALISNGTYIVEIDQKIGEDEYDTIFRSQPMEIKGGIIKREFKIT